MWASRHWATMDAQRWKSWAIMERFWIMGLELKVSVASWDA